ncbi:RebB family R body protein (plasmid) [Candidatus Bealeia paramacronuclearis]|uniref:RebB family R body protein n=1 Tax=Candidatus Bealeia paramacronuclearis TaxID=1921001 RepID=A0ABZ2C9A1_9PROT
MAILGAEDDVNVMDGVNNQITDAVTQSSVQTIGESASVAVSNLYQSVSNSFSTMIQNAVFDQQQSTLLQQTETIQGVNMIYSIDTAAIADATEKTARADFGSNAMNEMSILSIAAS